LGTEERDSSHHNATDNHATNRQKHARKHQSIKRASRAEALQKETATVLTQKKKESKTYRKKTTSAQ